ncbi:MAG: GAF domain-containing protein [Candidatus Limnocylindria bacterium]
MGREKQGGAPAKRRAAPRGRAGDREAELRRRLAEALEQQTATAEVLRAMSRSASELGPVLDSVLQTAARLARAQSGVIFRIENGTARAVAAHGVDEGFRRAQLGLSMDRPGRENVIGRAWLERRPVQIEDVLADTEISGALLELQRIGGFRTMLGVPILREDHVVGLISLRRNEVRPFTDAEIEMVTTFADQAAIAIENVRLFNETKEALERQTAVADVLQAISGSVFDLDQVLRTITARAMALCGAASALLLRVEGDQLTAVVREGALLSLYDLAPGSRMPLDAETLAARSVRTRRAESAANSHERPEPPRAEGRSRLAVPIVRGDSAWGTLLLTRAEAVAFNDREIQLVQTFADQAAIAIENVRLFNETKEALEQQTATSEVLQVISRSPTELRPVFDEILSKAARLAEASIAALFLYDGSVLTCGGSHNVTPEFAEHLGRLRVTPSTETPTRRAALERRVVHVQDVRTDPDYVPSPAHGPEAPRTVLSLPMLREDRLVGVITVWRREVRAFSESQIQLLRTFADQAVIAIENVRLFNETKEALDQQAAVADVLKTISRSAFDLEPVLRTLVDTAARLAGADLAWMRTVAGGEFEQTGASSARYGRTDELLARFDAVDQSEPALPPGFQPSTVSVIGRTLRERRTLHVSDVQTEPELLAASSRIRRTGARTVLGVPLFREESVLGVMVLLRVEVRPFTEREIKLVETFADQAAIAIENVRLFKEIQQKSAQLEAASRHKSEFLANMSHELRTPLNAIIGFTDVMLEEMFGTLNEKQKEYLEDVRGSGAHLLKLINDILDLSKIEAGRVELDIAEFSFPDALENALTLVRERAARHGITMRAEGAAGIGNVTADERKLKQILVNLLSNAVKFTPDGGLVTVSARRANGAIEVEVGDTGIGIATEDQERIFEEFQQVGRDPDRAREGTGLGLTLAKRFVELHGGRMWVKSEVGKGSTFTFALPVRQTAPVSL